MSNDNAIYQAVVFNDAASEQCLTCNERWKLHLWDNSVITAFPSCSDACHIVRHSGLYQDSEFYQDRVRYAQPGPQPAVCPDCGESVKCKSFDEVPYRCYAAWHYDQITSTAQPEVELPQACPHCKSNDVQIRNFMPGYFKADYRCENEWHRQQLRVMAQAADSQEVEVLRAEIARLNTLVESYQLGANPSALTA